MKKKIIIIITISTIIGAMISCSMSLKGYHIKKEVDLEYWKTEK